MNIKKIVIALLLIVALVATLLTGLTRQTYAADDGFSATLSPSAGTNDRVPLGGTFDVTLTIKNINLSGGISGITAVLKYNEDIVELVNNKVTGLNDFQPTYNPDNGKLVLDAPSAVKNETEIAKFTFKVKDKTTAKIAQIDLGSIEGGNSDPDLTDPVKIKAINTTVLIGASGEDPTPSTSSNPSTQPSQTTNPSSNPQPSTSGGVPGTSDGVKTQTPAPNTTRSEEEIPKSGSEDYIIPLIIAIAALGLISFVNYKKID